MGSASTFGTIWLLMAYFGVPILLTRFVIRGKWIEILQAYGVWMALLAMFGLLAAGSRDEGFGWALILALFWTILAIPILVLLLKLRSRLKARAGRSL
jgi:hypothetical protein